MNSIITPGVAGIKINEDSELEAMDVTGSDSISEIPDTGVIVDPNDFAHADQNWITPEEIERSYKSQKKAPSSLKAFFGPVIIKELQDVLNDNHLLEIESLVAKKELTLPEAVEYFFLPIKRNRITEFACSYVGEQSGRRYTLWDDLRRQRRGFHADILT